MTREADKQPRSKPQFVKGHLDREVRDRGFFVDEWEEEEVMMFEDSWEEEEPQDVVLLASNERRVAQNCVVCAASHPLAKCEQFLAMAPKQRKEVLRKDRRCYLCFQKGHNV